MSIKLAAYNNKIIIIYKVRATTITENEGNLQGWSAEKPVRMIMSKAVKSE